MTFYTVGNPDILSMVEEFVIQEQIYVTVVSFSVSVPSLMFKIFWIEFL